MSLFKKKKKEFVLIDFNKNGAGVEKDDETLSGPPYTIKRGTRLFFSHYWKMISINMLSLFFVIPLALVLIFYFTGPKTPVQETVIYAPLAGISVFEAHNSIPIEMILDFHAHELGLPIITFSQFLKLSIPLLFLFITFGWQNCGLTYISRSLINGDPVFVWSDYFYAIKKNLKQGFLMGMLDFAVIFALAVDYIFFSTDTGVFWNDLMYFFIIALAVIYMFMRFYLYLIIVTFDMKITKILKNSFFFAILGVKRNLMAVLCSLAYVLCFVVLYFLLSYINIGITSFVFCAFTIFAVTSFISTYCAYPVIDKYMIIREEE
ncbi:MAG: hypothetical protein IIX97_03460 [Clostridia bacterium]|nr:hypothetical protein [Clostridia bacterium]